MILALGLFGFNAKAQNHVSGTLLDNKEKPLGAATVSLLKALDSVVVKSIVTDADGKFDFASVKAGRYLLLFQAYGYIKKTTSSFVLTENMDHQAGTVKLLPTTSELGEVVVRSSNKKPLIEAKADKMVFNVENSINATGSNALEVLQKTPGIQVDNNDNISMKGKTGVKIYIDGKISQLDAKEVAAYLRGINSNDVEAIEMIANPGAKYDASGNAGVINIKLKKNKKFGYNGSVNMGYVEGITPKYNAALNMNYRDQRYNLFGNVTGEQGNYENIINLYRTQNDSIYDQRGTNYNFNKNANGKVGLDLFLNPKSTLGFLVNYSYGNSDRSSISRTNIYKSKNLADSFVKSLLANNDQPQTRLNANANVNYHYADTSGLEINTDLDHGIFRGTGKSFQPNYYTDKASTPLSTAIYRNNTPTDIDIYSVKTDIERNLWKGKLGFGGKVSYVKTTNSFEFFSQDPISNAVTKLLSKSNSFVYTENVNALYLNLNQKFSDHWSLQAGVRMEQTNSKGTLTRADGQKQSDDTVSRTYTNLFPSTALTYNLNKANSFTLTYSRRIDRPSYQDLNPFENKLDELTYQKGNAFLRPQYTDNFELAHTLMGFLNTTVGYSNVKDYATVITDTVRNASYIQDQNLATQQILSFSIGSPLPIRKWWNGYANVWYNYQFFEGKFNNKDVKLEIPLYGAYLQSTFNLGKSYNAEISGWYNGPSIWGTTWFNRPQGGIDLGLQKDLLNKKATIKLSSTNILFTNPWNAITDFGGLRVEGNGNWESRTVRVNFTYRFGNSQLKSSRERKTGLEAESKRIK